MSVSKIFDLLSEALQHYKLFWDAYSQNINFWERSRGALQHYRLILNVHIENLSFPIWSTTALQAVLRRTNPKIKLLGEVSVGTTALQAVFERLYQNSVKCLIWSIQADLRCLYRKSSISSESCRLALQEYRLILNVSTKNLAMSNMSTTALQEGRLSLDSI